MNNQHPFHGMERVYRPPKWPAIGLDVLASGSFLKSAFQDGCGSLVGSFSFCVVVFYWSHGGVNCASRGSIVSPSTIPGWLLAVVDNVGLDGLVISICSGSSSLGAVWVLPVSKWNWNVCAVPSRSFKEDRSRKGSLSAIFARSSFQSLVKELA
ncbi:hypothetical protein Tco_1000834 [Tanacetum coccineum]